MIVMWTYYTTVYWVPAARGLYAIALSICLSVCSSAAWKCCCWRCVLATQITGVPYVYSPVNNHTLPRRICASGGGLLVAPTNVPCALSCLFHPSLAFPADIVNSRGCFSSSRVVITGSGHFPWTYPPGHIPPGHSPARTIPPPFLHGVGHFPLPPPPSANLQYKAIYQ